MSYPYLGTPRGHWSDNAKTLLFMNVKKLSSPVTADHDHFEPFLWFAKLADR